MCSRTERPCVPGQPTVGPRTDKPCVPGLPDPVSQHSQTLCRRTARPCVVGQPDLCTRTARPASGCDAARNPSGHPCAVFLGTRGGVPAVPTPQLSAEQRPRGKRSPRLGQAPLPALRRPPSRGRPRLPPCPLRTYRPLRGAGAGPPAEPRAAPSARRPSPAGTASAAASLRHQDWHRSATGNKSGSGTAPAPGAGPAAAPGARRAQLRRARGPPALPPAPPPRPGSSQPASRRGRNRAAPALPCQERSLGTAELPLSPVPKGHTALTPLRSGDSPLPWAAVPGLDSPFCEGIFQMSNLNFSCHSLRQIPLALSLVTWEQRPTRTWL